MIYNEVGTRKPQAGDTCRMSVGGGFTLTDFEWRKSDIAWEEVRYRRDCGRKFEVIECNHWDSMTIQDTVTKEIYTDISPFGFEMLSEKVPELNPKLVEVNDTHAIAERLEQIFLDADELNSDVTNELGQCLIELEDASDAKRGQLEETIKVLRAVRIKLANVMHDYKVHYTLSHSDPAAGLRGLLAAAKNYKE